MENNQNATHYREQRHKPLTAAQAQKILKNGGTDVTVDGAEKILEFLRPLAWIALDSAMESAERDRRLENEPKGFLFEKAGYTCQICGHSAYNGWYDRNGLRCSLCQQAIKDQIIPAMICNSRDLYYTEIDLQQAFNLKGKVPIQWIRQGVIKCRTICAEGGKGKDFRIFLMEDNENFLPSKEMLVCHGHYEKYINGKILQVPLRWYQAQENPASYLKEYGIKRLLDYAQPSGK